MMIGSILAALVAVLALQPARAASPTASGLAEFQQGRFAEALQDWRQAHAAGDAQGAFYVGVLYDTGLGVPQDYTEALAWYRRAADAGSAAGAFNVGVFYDSGLGVAKDPAAAALWYTRAARGGFARAAYNLAMLYESGTGVLRNRARAIEFYTQAAREGISAAQQHLRALGQHAQPAPAMHPDLGMMAFQQAQQALLQRGPADAARATALFRLAAAQHNALAEYDLGYCYEAGLGVPRDLVKAQAWYYLARDDAKDPALRSIAGTASDNLLRKIARNDPK